MTESFTYEKLAGKYDNFGYPAAEFTVKDKKFAENKEGFLIDGLEIELVSGFEASVAEFSIYNAYDAVSGEFLTKKLASWIELGADISISLGYLCDMTEVFYGFVAGMNYGYESGDLPYVKVTALDIKGIMMANRYSMQLKSKSFGEAVREILTKPAYNRLAGDLKISDTPDKKQGNSEKASEDTVEMTSESDYEFVVKAAKRFNYEFFAGCRTIYFRRAKSRTELLLSLGINRGIVTFDVRYSLTGLVESVEVRSVQAGSGKLISSVKKRSGKLSSGSAAARLLKKSRLIYHDPTAVSKDQTDARCEYLLDTVSRRFGELDARCVGLPELTPGRFIRLEGLGETVSNKFYINKVVHRFGEDGYSTRIIGTADRLEEAAGGMI